MLTAGDGKLSSARGLVASIWLVVAGLVALFIQYSDVDLAVPEDIHLARVSVAYMVGGLVFGVLSPRRWRAASLTAWATVAFWGLVTATELQDPLPHRQVGELVDVLLRRTVTMVVLPALFSLLGGYAGSRVLGWWRLARP